MIVMFGCPQDSVDIALDKEHPFLEEGDFRIKLTKFTFNLHTGEAGMRVLNDDLSVEFPVIN